jgi:hypothetical protein
MIKIKCKCIDAIYLQCKIYLHLKFKSNNMKFIKNLLVAGIALTSLSVSAQTADEIVSKNIEAMGGAAKIATLTSVKMSGNMSAQGNDFPITITKSHMKGMRVDLDIMGTANYQILTPEKGYMFFPIQQMTEPKELDAETVAMGQSQLDIQGGLFNYKEKGSTIELVGKDKVDGAEAYKLKVTMKSGKSVMYFIDTKTNRILKTAGKMSIQGQETDVETTFSDYKQNADGYWFAYTTTTPQGPLSFDKIESNVKVDETIFKN